MGQKNDSDLTPEDLAHKYLPEQTMYKVQTPEAHGEDPEGVRHSPLIIRTNEFRLLYFELGPSGEIDWHTHVPGLDEVNLCLEGRARYTLEREDGSHQTLEIGPMEFVYVPGGARHKIEAIDGQAHRSLSAAKFDTAARLENLEDVSEESDTGGSKWQDALFVDRKRDEVVAKDDTLVSE
ncbi:cupin domain-containing protein [Halorubrum sp. Atlit-26R]|uniref:cupin domain-containing protein n=1 Tax=Halorubrum sp. Atlit-26R TaxID=2282128 RepID=UPI000EF1D339|nr:cupin domain-containing protein [Halorubrum sp. Atlit-26R]RLM63306.1 cupin domain-containing protein [Halorubrum sp. Atlit-26R]